MVYKKYGSIKEIPKMKRPREKLIRYGPEKLSNHELLSILLRSGHKGENALKLSKRILKKFSSQELINLEFSNLINCSGIGEAKACGIIACFELGKRFLKGKKTELLMSSRDVWQEMKDIRNKKKEHCVVFYLDTQNQIIKREIISIGTLDLSIVHPREVFELAVKTNASHIVISHNHPSGNVRPSREDIELTKRLIKAGKILGIQVVDHIIVSEENYFSLNDEGLI